MVCQRCRGLLVREIFDDLSAEAGITFLPHDVSMVSIRIFRQRQSQAACLFTLSNDDQITQGASVTWERGHHTEAVNGLSVRPHDQCPSILGQLAATE